MLNIYKALLKSQSEYPKIEKDAKNLHFKNAYATLPSVLSAVLPVLQTNGVLFTSREIDEGGQPFMLLQLIHVSSGELIENKVKLINAIDMQKLGSAYTYATRYGLLSMLGISPDLDDDGNSTAITLEDLTKLYNLKKDLIAESWKIPAETVMKNKESAKYASLYNYLKGLN